MKSILEQNTVVVYTSDQGFFLGDHGLYDKRFMYEHALRMPLLIRFPGTIRAGSQTDLLASNLDFAPTLLELAGVQVPPEFQGRSLAAIARGAEPTEWRSAVYYRFYEKAYGIGPHEGIRTDRHKLIHFLYGDGGWEFYDLEQDPDELNNRIDDPACRPLVQALKTRMTELRRQYRAEEPDPSISP